jgi:DNA-binding transcriptional MerR regulator
MDTRSIPEKFSLETVMKESGFTEMEKEQFDEMFTLKDLGVSARVLQNWSENGLLIEKERGKDMNHKFNFIELMWLKIILELRQYGFPLEKIKRVKESIVNRKSFPEAFNWKTDEDIVDGIYGKWIKPETDKKKFRDSILKSDVIKKIKNKKFIPLQFFILNYLKERHNAKILISEYGDAAHYVEEEFIPNVRDILDKESYLSIPLYKLILNFVKDEKKFQLIPQTGILTNDEIHILVLIKSGLFKDIKITFKNNKPLYLEAKRNIDIVKEARLYELFLTGAYEEITVINNNGIIVSSTKITKIKFQ